MAFDEIRFPAALSFGASGGPERRTDIVTLANGFEERNTPWAQSRRRFDAGLGLRSLDDLADLVAFFEARRGQLRGFRWKDWADHTSCAPSGTPDSADQEIGVSDGVTTSFSLIKRYGDGDAAYSRPVTKPVASSVMVAVGGGVLVHGRDFVVDHRTGLVTLTAAPVPGAVITAGFAFDVPVRFDTDRIVISAAGFQAGQIPSVPVVEVRI